MNATSLKRLLKKKVKDINKNKKNILL